MSFTKEQIVSAMRQAGIVPLFTHEDPETALNMVQAAYRGGMRVFEFTNRKSNSFDVFCHLIKNRQQFPDLAMGIGTVMDGATTKKFIDAGADFIISPILRIEMGDVCKQYNKHWIPGCATISEIAIAKDHGAEVIKISDYQQYKTEVACKEAGKIGVEGKEYVVQDGDVMHFRFNV